MKTIFDELQLEVKNWWISLILGILYVIVAISLMFSPLSGYAVLSILFSVSKPFFLFFSRNKDDGMPPRKQAADQPAPGSNDWVDVQADEL